MVKETAEQIALVDHLLTQSISEADEKERRRLLAGIAVIGAYIKRYGNLLLMSARTKSADIRELSRCFDESFCNLELLDVNCLQTLSADTTLAIKDMLHVYRCSRTAQKILRKVCMIL